MFSIEDPFVLSNREIRRMLRRGGKAPGFWEKLAYVLKREGIKGVARRAVDKLHFGL